MTTPRTDAAPCCAHTKVIYKRINHEGGTCSDSWICQDCNHNFWPQAFSEIVKKKLETELIALQEEHDLLVQTSGELCNKCNWRMKFPDELCRCELEKERNQLLATVEGLRESFNLFLVRVAPILTPELGKALGPLAESFESLPPTNLVKRSVLEKCYNALFGFREFSGDDAAFPLLQCEEALKEAHEELQRTAK